MDSNLGALCRVGCKNIIRTLPGGEEGGGDRQYGGDGEHGVDGAQSHGVEGGHHIAGGVGGYRVGRGSDKYLLDTGRGFVLAIETVMYTLHLFRRLCLCIQITTQASLSLAVETNPRVIWLAV